MDKTFYTELIYRHKTTEDYGPREVAVRETIWDMGLDGLLGMFHTIAAGGSWTDDQFELALAEYLEERGFTVIPPGGDRDDENEDGGKE